MFSQISCCIKVGRSIFPNTSPLQQSSVRFSLLMFPYQCVDCTTHIGFGRTSICTGKLAGIFTMGPQYQPGHKAKKIPCVPFPTSFWASFPPRCGMDGDPIPFIISDPPIFRMPFFGAHPVCGLVYWCQHTQIHVPVPLVSVHLKVFSCEPLRSFILHLFCR